MKPLLLFVITNPAFFLSHRLPIALAAREAGYEVHLASMPSPAVAQVQALGFKHHALPLHRTRKNPWLEALSLWAMVRLFLKLKPDLVHLVTIKSVIYGSLAARITGVPGVVAAISGLGYVFTQQGIRVACLRALVMVLYGVAFGKDNLRVIFQNRDDLQTFSQFARLGKNKMGMDKAVLVRGSGVDLQAFAATPEPAGPPVVLMASRLLKDKGVLEFVQAARLIRQQGNPASQPRFWLAGEVDLGYQASCTQAEVDGWQAEGVVQWLGNCQDMPALLASSHMVVLPSYREGLPRVLCEAAACARAVVTTDMPGCRDAMERGTDNNQQANNQHTATQASGLLVPVRNAQALAQAIQTLLDMPEMRQDMGRAGRALAEAHFDIKHIVQMHLAIYQQLLNQKQPV
jgi:glycosyltransferase involved in cell wall biosynthesis